MPSHPRFVDELPMQKEGKGRGRKGAPMQYKEALRQNPGRWGRMCQHTSALAAQLVANFWDSMYPDLEFKAVGRTVYGRFVV